MKSKKPLVYLADLTHLGRIVAANFHPLGIGLIAAHLKTRFKDEIEVELFKYPQDFDQALQRRQPCLVGLTNYSWNYELSSQFAASIKRHLPKTCVVMGGPNYGTHVDEINKFRQGHPTTDFYLIGEGELAFANLFVQLREKSFDVARLKADSTPLANAHYWQEGCLVHGEILPRINDFDEVGSPYLMGLMDKFFDGVLIPMVHTTRGCPFTCAFCTEGSKYYCQVVHRKHLHQELEYIAVRSLHNPELLITDANFGMYAQDVQKAQILAGLQKKYNWPKRLNVSTGKNNKERVVQIASMLNGALTVGASLQSTDKEVLKNVNRANISLTAIQDAVREANKDNVLSFTEVILALPGDTREKHIQTLRDVVNSGLGIVRMYQLIMLARTELNSPEYRQKYGMKTKFRINPRSLGVYKAFNETVTAIDYEEICIENNTLSFQDYIDCRELNLSVEIIHNTGLFLELTGLCNRLGVSWFEVILDFYDKRRTFSPGLTDLYDTFTSNSIKRLWETREDLIADVSKNAEHYIYDPCGTNEMASAKSIAFFSLQQELRYIIYHTILREQLRSRDLLDDIMELYLTELEKYSVYVKNDLISEELSFQDNFHFDLIALNACNFERHPKEVYNLKPKLYSITHSAIQKELIKSARLQYGDDTVDGRGRILMRTTTRELFRPLHLIG